MSSTSSYELDTPRGQVRLLLNDVADPFVFTDDEVDQFLTMEAGDPKLAAAQAIDTRATNMALAMRVFRTQDLSTDGAKVAAAMREHADRLRTQAYTDDGFVDIIEAGRGWGPELAPGSWY